MEKCSICGGDGPMIVMHQSCLYDLPEALCYDDDPLCNLCGSVELCLREIERGKPELIDCKHHFRLDPAKDQEMLREVTAWVRLTPPDKREQRRRMWLYAEPKRCKRLINVLRWAWWNRVELLMLALCFFAVIGAEWFARLLLQRMGG